MIGRARLVLANISPMVAPSSERKALPGSSSRKRATSIVWKVCATALGMSHTREDEQDMVYMGMEPEDYSECIAMLGSIPFLSSRPLTAD